MEAVQYYKMGYSTIAGWRVEYKSSAAYYYMSFF